MITLINELVAQVELDNASCMKMSLIGYSTTFSANKTLHRHQRRRRIFQGCSKKSEESEPCNRGSVGIPWYNNRPAHQQASEYIAVRILGPPDLVHWLEHAPTADHS